MTYFRTAPKRRTASQRRGLRRDTSWCTGRHSRRQLRAIQVWVALPGQRHFVDGFEQSRAECLMQINGTVSDHGPDFVFMHLRVSVPP